MGHLLYSTELFKLRKSALQKCLLFMFYILEEQTEILGTERSDLSQHAQDNKVVTSRGSSVKEVL